MWQNLNFRKLWIANTVSSLGTQIGGWLASQWGLRPVLFLSSSGLFMGILWVWYSPLRAFTNFPGDST
jgi:hypothetical protein